MAESAGAASVNQGSQVYSNSGKIINNFGSASNELTEVLLQAIKVHLEKQTESGNKSQKSTKSNKKHSRKNNKSARLQGPSVEEFTTFYQHDPSLIPTDYQNLVRMQFDLKRLDHDRLIALIRAPPLQSFLLARDRPILLLNGGGSSLPQSEASFLSAKLVESIHSTMVTNYKVLVLAFFCGQHRDKMDVYSNPSEMMMSLLLQMVEFCGALSAEDLLACMSDLNPTDVNSICSAFENLVETLDEDFRVFIVLDGVQFFAEPASRGEKMREIVKGLLGICRKNHRAVLKLLLASPTRSTFVEDLFEEGEVLTLPIHCRPAGVYGGTTLAGLISMTEEGVEGNHST